MMGATLLTEWQCNNILQEKRPKSWVQHVKTIPGNLLLTVKIIIQIPLAGATAQSVKKLLTVRPSKPEDWE